MCSLEQDHQFDTKFVDLEAYIDVSVEKPTLLKHKMGCKGHQRSNLRWLPILLFYDQDSR